MPPSKVHRGVVLTTTLQTFLRDCIHVFGLLGTAKRLRLSSSCVRATFVGFRCDLKVALAILALAKRLGFDRQQWLKDLPTDAPPPTAKRRERKSPSPQPSPATQQRTLF